MKFELAPICAPNDFSMSFSNQSSWIIPGATLPKTFGDQTYTHSSVGALKVSANSHGFTQFIYNFNDYQRYLPDRYVQNTHSYIFYGYAFQEADAVNRFKINLKTAGQTDVASVSVGTGFSRYNATVVGSGRVTVEIDVSTNDAPNVGYFDDFLVGIDPINLNPNIDFLNTIEQSIAESTAINGRYARYSWGDNQKYTVPVRFLSQKQAEQINFWWRNQFPMMFTFDNSRFPEQTAIVRITNDSQPVSRLIQPYYDNYEAVLELTNINYGLEF